MERMYDLYYTNSRGEPSYKVGKQNWKPMTHEEACIARSKFRIPSEIVLVEVVPPVSYVIDGLAREPVNGDLYLDPLNTPPNAQNAP